MKDKPWHVCSECNKERQRCRAVSVDAEGTITWVCRQCWKDLDYDHFMYEHHNQEKGYGHGI